eukprot:3827249-Prorocentrum_lima.AAC.1
MMFVRGKNKKDVMKGQRRRAQQGWKDCRLNKEGGGPQSNTSTQEQSCKQMAALRDTTDIS